MKLYLPAARTTSHLSRRAPVVRHATAYAPGLLWREPEALMNRAFRQSSPRYELTNTAEKFEIAVDVPGVKASDINISLENDGKILTLSGHRERKAEGYAFSNRFSQSFSLDPTVNAEKITANLNNGVLVVSAPKDPKRLEEAVKRIPITENAEPERLAVQNPEKEQPALENATTDVEAAIDSANNAKAGPMEEEIVVETVDESAETKAA